MDDAYEVKVCSHESTSSGSFVKVTVDFSGTSKYKPDGMWP